MVSVAKGEGGGERGQAEPLWLPPEEYLSRTTAVEAKCSVIFPNYS